MEGLTRQLLAGTGLSRRYGPVVALHPTDLAVEPGQIVAIVGPNGCGKSTLLRALAGIARGEGVGGAATYRGDTLDREARARVLAFVPQRPEVAADFTAREVVRLGRFARGADDAAVDRALAAVGLSARASMRVQELSGGERQRVAIARALAQVDGAERPVLLLDEPFAGIDPGEIARIVAALRALAASGAVVLTLHEPGLARAFATHAAAMRDGRVVASGAAREVLVPATLTSAYGHPIDESTAWLAPRLEANR